MKLSREVLVKVAHRLKAVGLAGSEVVTKAGALPVGASLIEDAAGVLGVHRSQIIQGLAALANMPFVDLRVAAPHPEALALLPEAIARKYRALGMYLNGRELTVAICNPSSWQELDALRAELPKYELLYAIADPEEVAALLTACYPAEVEGAVKAYLMDPLSAETRPPLAGKEAPVTAMIDAMVARAVRIGVSDLHLEPFEPYAQVRMRIDGMMRRVFVYHLSLHDQIIQRLKVLSNLNTVERQKPQDGRLTVELESGPVELRLSTLRVLLGEKAVMRVMRGEGGGSPRSLEALGMPPKIMQRFKALLGQPHGMILVTGPTGSGKTSTLYASLKHLDNGERNIISVEDPVEAPLPGINQVPLRPEIEFTYALALKAILRQDPDVIMVGEIRDGDTADIAIRGALTGHVLLSTLHTNGAVETVARILEMGVKPGNLAPALLGVIAQRLVRRICGCHELRQAMPAEFAVLGLVGLTEPVPVPQARGCPACDQTGYRGRLVLFELLVMDDALRAVVLSSGSAQELSLVAKAQGMESMALAGLREVLAGKTTLEEVLRVVHTQEHGEGH